MVQATTVKLINGVPVCNTCGTDISHKHKNAKFCDFRCMAVSFSINEQEAFHTSYTVTPSGCWEWNRNRNVYGYGRIGKKNRAITAHRLSWEINRGPIPPGLFICHKCDNPPCVNPDHLFLGTCKDNLNDMWSKGRYKVRRGELATGSKLTKDQAIAIYLDGRKHLDIAQAYGVTRECVGRIKQGRTWSWATSGFIEGRSPSWRGPTPLRDKLKAINSGTGS